MNHRKRGNGSGSVTWSAKRARWLATITGRDGRQQRKTVPPEIARTNTAPNRKRALDWMLAWKAKELAPAPPRSPRSMREQLGAYLAHLASIERKPRTLRTMGSVVDNALIPALGAIPVVDLRALHLREAYQQFRDKGRGAGYVHLAQAIVSGALKLAVADGIVAANVAAGVRTAPVPKRNPPIVGEHIEVGAFLAAIAGARFESAYIVALACGLRNHELRALRWADVDLERGELVVSGGTQPSAKGEVRGGTKSPSGLRRVAFGSFVAEKLKAQQNIAPAWNAESLVWPDATGGIVGEQRLTQELHARLAAAGLPDLRVHDLKHAFVTNSLGAGVDLATVSRTAGHSSVGVTVGVYSHATRRGDRAVADAGDALFTPKGGREKHG
jgi:integrase